MSYGEKLQHLSQEDRLIRKQVIEKNLALVKLAIKRHFSSIKSISFEDLFQYGCIALIQAVDTYDPNRGEFSTYAITCIRYYIYVQLKAKYNQTLPLLDQNPLTTSEDDLKYTIESIPDDSHLKYEQVEWDERAKILYKMMESFTECEQTIFYLHIHEDMNHAEIARYLGKSHQNVSEIIARIKNTLKSEFERLGLSYDNFHYHMISRKPLSEIDCEILNLYFNENLRATEIASKLNLTLNKVSYVIKSKQKYFDKLQKDIV
ncbi:MAG: sigma-70 family RNA polymerase sigma factor [Clostridiales bacterium]|nr:sigma-70 family RNA polymerase sigma factor [Clostridiales bacterium]